MDKTVLKNLLSSGFKNTLQAASFFMSALEWLRAAPNRKIVISHVKGSIEIKAEENGESVTISSS